VDDVVITSAQVAQAKTGTSSGVVQLELEAEVAPPASAELYPLLDGSAGTTTGRTVARLIPYFLWGNREAGAMRVWLRTY